MSLIITPFLVHTDPDYRAVAHAICATYGLKIGDVFLIEIDNGEAVVHRWTDGPPLVDDEGFIIEDQPAPPSRVDRYPWPAA